MHTFTLLPSHNATVGMIGLGQMGLSIARHLLRAGYHLRTFDLNTDRLNLLECTAQVTPVRSVEEVALPGCIVVSVVSDDQVIRHNEKALSSALSHGIHLGLSTIAPRTARWAEEAYQQA